MLRVRFDGQMCINHRGADDARYELHNEIRVFLILGKFSLTENLIEILV